MFINLAELTSAWEGAIVSIKRSVRTLTAIVWTLSQLRMSQTLLKKWVEFCTARPVACFGSQMFHQKGNDEFSDTYILLSCGLQWRIHKSIFASQCNVVFKSYLNRVSLKKSLLLNPPLKLIRHEGNPAQRLVSTEVDVDRTDNSIPEKNIKAKFCLGHPVQKKTCETAVK